MHPFGAALEARDVEAAVAVLADDVVFSSPIVYRPYAGKRATTVCSSRSGGSSRTLSTKRS